MDLDLEDRDVYKVAGPVDLTVLAALYKLEGFRELKEPTFDPQMPAVFTSRANVFAAIREQDILVHHPYGSFGSVVSSQTSCGASTTLGSVSRALLEGAGTGTDAAALRDNKTARSTSV